MKVAKNIGLLVFAVIGLSIAAILFFTTFISNQKASTPSPHKYQNLIIPVPSDPPKPGFPKPLYPSLIPIPSLEPALTETTAETQENTENNQLPQTSPLPTL